MSMGRSFSSARQTRGVKATELVITCVLLGLTSVWLDGVVERCLSDPTGAFVKA